MTNYMYANIRNKMYTSELSLTPVAQQCDLTAIRSDATDLTQSGCVQCPPTQCRPVAYKSKRNRRRFSMTKFYANELCD